MQIELRFGADDVVMIADEFPEYGVVSPLALGGTYRASTMTTDDVDALLGTLGARGGCAGVCTAPGRVLGRAPLGRSSIRTAIAGGSRNICVMSTTRLARQAAVVFGGE